MDDIKSTYEMFSEIWKFYKTYKDCRTDSEFEQMNAAQKEICRRHNTEFCKELLLVVLNEIDRQERHSKVRAVD